MTMIEDPLRTYLEAIGALTTILTGGIYDASELDRLGYRLFEANTDSRGRLQPAMVIRWRSGSPFGPHYDSERQTVELWYYDFSGRDNITAAMRVVYNNLHRQLVTATNFGLCWYEWNGNRGEFMDEALGNASGDMDMYRVTFLRR